MTDSWRENAACAKHPSDWWFAEGTSREAQIQRATAIAVCNTCPVKQACADWAIENPESSRFGIWGGMSGRRRVQLMHRPLQPDAYHTKAVRCACGTVFYCAPSRLMKHCSGACLDAARVRSSRLAAQAAAQRLRDEKNPPDELRLRNREAARRSRARARERAAREAAGLTFPTEIPGVFPLDPASGVVFSGSEHDERTG